MLDKQQAKQRSDFFEQLHKQFIHLKGYGAYAYITPHDMDQLYDSYREQQKALISSLSRGHTQINFIRSFIKTV